MQSVKIEQTHIEDGKFKTADTVRYFSCYRQHYMQQDDNPPIGLLLCTAYGKEMVEYLTPFTDPQLFVARYELALPSKEKIQDFLMKENKQ